MENNNLTNTHFEIRTSGDKSYLYTEYPIVTRQDIMTFAGDQPELPSIFNGLPIDTNTLSWNEDGELTVIGGFSGGGGTGLDETAMWDALNVEGEQQINQSHINGALENYFSENINGKYVNLNGAETISGEKTFSSDIHLNPSGGLIRGYEGKVVVNSGDHFNAFGNSEKPNHLYSDDSDLLHYKAGTAYKVWDSSNSNLTTVDWNANDLYLNNFIYMNGKEAVRGSDSWLRLNNDGHFVDGIFCGNSLLRTDGKIELGVYGSSFYANNSGQVYAAKQFLVGTGYEQDGALNERYIAAYGKTGHSYINFGYAPSPGNTGEIVYTYKSSGNSENYISLGFYHNEGIKVYYNRGANAGYINSNLILNAGNYTETLDQRYAYHQRLAQGSDCDGTITCLGVREIQQPLNSPNTSWPWIQTLNWGSQDPGYGTQLASAYTQHQGLWMRQKIGGVFGPWKILWDESNANNENANWTTRKLVATNRVVCGYDSGVAGSVNASNWFRSSGSSGWYNETYNGGIYMLDYEFIRTYGGKRFHVDSTADVSVYDDWGAVSTQGGIKAMKTIWAGGHLIANSHLLSGGKTDYNDGKCGVLLTPSGSIKLYHNTTPCLDFHYGNSNNETARLCCTYDGSLTTSSHFVANGQIVGSDTTDVTSATSLAAIYTNGGLRVSKTIWAGGNIFANGAITAKATSDRRLKTNFRDIDANDLLLSLGKIRSFDYNERAKEFNANTPDSGIGLVYQQAIKTFPAMSAKHKGDKYGSLNYLHTDYINLIGAATQQTFLRFNQFESKVEKELRQVQRELKQVKNELKKYKRHDTK